MRSASLRHTIKRVDRIMRGRQWRPVVAIGGLCLAVCILYTLSAQSSQHSSSSITGKSGAASRQQHKNALFGAEDSRSGVPAEGVHGAPNATVHVEDSAPSPYCNPRNHQNLRSMWELAHRSFDIPLDEHATAGIKPIVEESVDHPLFQKSIDQLLRERNHDWQYVLEGSLVTRHPFPSLLEPPNPFSNLDAGFYCLSVWDDVDSCIVASVPFVVVSELRKNSEYGVTPIQLEKRTHSYRSVVSAIEAYAKQEGDTRVAAAPFLHRDVNIMYSKYLPLRSAAPLVFSIPAVLDAFYAKSDFASNGGEFIEHSPTVMQRHVRLGGDDGVDIEYGKGSMWVMTGETFRRARIELADREKRLLDTLKDSGRKEPIGRAVFEQYTAKRFLLTSLPEEEDPTFAPARLAGRENEVRSGRKLHALDHERSPHKKRRRDTHDDEEEHAAKRHRTSQLSRISVRVDAIDATIDLIEVPLDKMFSPRSAADLLQYFASLDGATTAAAARKNASQQLPGKEDDISKSVCLVRIAWSIEFDASINIHRECLITVDDRISITIKKGAHVHFSGLSPQAPMLFTSNDVISSWGGFVVEDSASLTITNSIVHKVGSTGLPRVKGTGTHIKHFAPVFSLVPGSGRLTVSHSAILNCEGTVFALGKGTQTRIEHTLVQDVAQGGECVSCNVNISHAHFMDVPFTSTPEMYIDGDNDAFYFRGGHAVVEHTVFLNALDDCIDSASTTGDAEHSTLTLRHVAIENCQHEGVALSGSKGTRRTVTIENSLVSHCQQGIENGHTPVKHMAQITNTVFTDNHIAVRNGDNYPTLDVFGKVELDRCLLTRNTMPVLDWVQIDHGRKTHRDTFFNPKMYHYECHNPLLVDHEDAQVGGTVLVPLVSLKNCIIDDGDDGRATLSTDGQQNDDAVEVPGTYRSYATPSSSPAKSTAAAQENMQQNARRHRSGFVPREPAEGIVAAGRHDDGRALLKQRISSKNRQASLTPLDTSVRKFSSVDFEKGIFCGHRHFLVADQTSSSASEGGVLPGLDAEREQRAG